MWFVNFVRTGDYPKELRPAREASRAAKWTGSKNH
jgi:hypothetical protein